MTKIIQPVKKRQPMQIGHRNKFPGTLKFAMLRLNDMAISMRRILGVLSLFNMHVIAQTKESLDKAQVYLRRSNGP